MSHAEKVNVTVQLEQDMLTQIDERAAALDLNRSQYFRRLVRQALGNPQPELKLEALPNLNGKKEEVHA